MRRASEWFRQLCSHLGATDELAPPAVASRPNPVAAPRREQKFEGIPADDTAALAEHYNQFGFVVIRGVLSKDEARSLLSATRELIDNAPVERGGMVDRHGRQCQHPGAYAFTDPVTADDARTYLQTGQGLVLNRISSPMPMAAPYRYVYGNPRMLRAVERIYGADFCPFAESLVLKTPHDGAGFQFHQDALRDGAFEQGPAAELGLNCGIYLTESKLDTGCLWVIPETHRRGRIDIENLARWRHEQVRFWHTVCHYAAPYWSIASLLSSCALVLSLRSCCCCCAEQVDGELPEGAVPVEVDQGDCIVHSRCVVHGSLPNLSPKQRATLYVGWFPYSAVSHNPPDVMRERRRAIVTAVALRSRSLEFKDERPFDTSSQERLINMHDGEADLTVPEDQVAQAFSTPTLGLLPTVQSQLKKNY